MIKIEIYVILTLVIMIISKTDCTEIHIFESNYVNFSEILIFGQNEQKYIIVSGKNYLLKFSFKDLSTPVEIRKTGPVNDSVLCTEPNKCAMSICSAELKSRDKCRVKPTDVYVKSWTIADFNLVVCYNVYQGFCETIDLYSNFSSPPLGKGYSIVTYDLNSHSTILHFQKKLYVAIEINALLNYQSIDFNTISIRTLPNIDIIKPNIYIFHHYYGRLGSGIKTIFPLEFKGSFHINDKRKDVSVKDYVFFLVNQPENKIDPKNGKFQMRLVRLCSNDEDFSSFIDIGLSCENKNPQIYYQIDSWNLAYVTDDVATWYREKTRFKDIKNEPEADFNHILYLNLKIIRITDNYKETLNSLVVCAFPIADIMELFDIVKNKCLSGTGSINERPYDSNANDSPCVKDDLSDSNRGYCGGKMKNKHIIGDHFGEHSGIGYKILTKDGFRGSSLIVVPIYRTYTIALIGGSDGRLYKFQFFKNESKQLATYKLFDDSFKMQIDENNSTVFAVSNSKIAIADFKICKNVTTCETCLQLSPYCGWCISQGKCSVRDQCIISLWIPYQSSEINMCPEIQSMPSYSISDYLHNNPIINFQISKAPKTIFDANSPYLKCLYLVNNNQIALTNAFYYFNNDSIACHGPTRNDIPLFRENENFISINLHVLINGSAFVKGYYYVYDCGHSKTCSRCTESRFNCTWCVLDNKCVPASKTKCTKSYGIHSRTSNECPKLELTNKTLAFNIESPVVIDLIVKEFKNYFHMKTEFYCFETCENSTVRAVLKSSEDIMRCSFKTIKLTSYGVVNCSLSVIWKLANQLGGSVESDGSMNFQVFDCWRLSQHCDDCLLLSSIYQCGFCSSTETCVQRHKCGDTHWINRKTQNCPSPIITEIIPENSTLSSETIILVRGRNLGFYTRDIENMISLENAQLVISCKFIDQKYISAKQFMCKIENFSTKIPTPVTFQFTFRTRLHYLARKEFHFYTPKVNLINPKRGPFMGGTVLEIVGSYLNIGLKQAINFKYGNFLIPCVIIRNSGEILSCRVNEFLFSGKAIRLRRNVQSNTALLQISIDQNTILFNNIVYQFSPDPKIIKVSRHKVLSEGGQIINITGENLELIHKPCLAFYCEGKLSNYEECHISDKDIYCITPSIGSKIERQKCDLLFGMENGTVSIYNTSISIFSRPLITKLNEKINLPSSSFSFIKPKQIHDKLPILFEIKDKISLDTFIESDINISIGSLSCSNISLIQTNVHCAIELRKIDVYQKYTVLLKIGKNIVIDLGLVQFEKGDISLDTITVIIITAIILILIVVIISISVLMVKKIKKNMKANNMKQNIFTDKIIKDAKEVIKMGITELNQVTIQNDIHRNWDSAPIHPYNVYILYNLFPNTHPRLYSENKHMNESIFDLTDYKSNNPTTHPLICNKQIQVIESTIEYSRKLSKLFEDELFVLIFFSFLEDYHEVDSKKSDIISFLSIILMKDMSNYTKILKILIKNDYDKKKSNDEEKSMFRQSDLLSKLLSNWFFILMYDHLQNINAGGDLLILYLNILKVINNGPVNYDNNKCYYTLNEHLLPEKKIEHNKLTLKVTHDVLESEAEIDVDVLDCDCISQVKLKIFEAIYKYTHYSKWSNMQHYDLVKDNPDESNENDQLIKSTTLKESYNKIYRTLKDYEIQNNDHLRLIFNGGSSIAGSNTASVSHSFHFDSTSASLKTNRSRNINKENAMFNFTPELMRKSQTDKLINNSQDNYHRKSKVTCFNKVRTPVSKDGGDIKLVFLINMQVLKNRIDQQVKNLFDDIFDFESVPPCITDLFTHFNNICKDDGVLFAVKSNSLILRFWIQLINNIDFLFDIPLVKHTPVLDNLKCISRVLMDICSEKQNKDAWLTQLFSDTMKVYGPKVLNYYDYIKTSSNCSYYEYYASSRIEGINISLAIVRLYEKYIKCVHDQFIEAIQTSNYPKNKQNEWIVILKEVNNLYIPESDFSESNGDIKTTNC